MSILNSCMSMPFGIFLIADIEPEGNTLPRLSPQEHAELQSRMSFRSLDWVTHEAVPDTEAQREAIMNKVPFMESGKATTFLNYELQAKIWEAIRIEIAGASGRNKRMIEGREVLAQYLAGGIMLELCTAQVLRVWSEEIKDKKVKMTKAEKIKYGDSGDVDGLF